MALPQLGFLYGLDGAHAPPDGISEGAAALAPLFTPAWSARGYGGAFTRTGAELALLAHMGSQYELKDSPGAQAAGLALHTPPAFYPYNHYQYGDPSRAKSATRETTSTLKAWLQEHKRNPYPTKGEKIMLAIITKMTLTQVSTWFANARRRLKKENKVTWGRSADDVESRLSESDNDEEEDKNEEEEDEEEEIDLETIDIDKADGERADLNEENVEEQPDGRESAQTPRAPSSPGPKNTASPVSNNKAQSAGEVSPGAADSHRSASAKPKIWSLAETATSPDHCHRASVPSAIAHPAFLSTSGIYTCQVGRGDNWAFLSASSLLGVRSMLGVSDSENVQCTPRSSVTHGGTPSPPCVKAHAEKASRSFRPHPNDEENIERVESPTLSLRAPFPVIHDRSHHETAQRALKSIS
ncbi:iroquois-class homeodomain protein IRX-1b [Salminus brasiliensis]|uniref:iroquois-class homeodomain protein IRX-1b n=1 Tax=Salminus brasiliensis TaxID=930266 RepID=UPI003B839380